MSESKPRIYVFVESHFASGDVGSYALADDGEFLAGHVSSNVSWAKHDMGLHGDWKHDKYAAHYPGGYELEWVDNPDEHGGLNAAYQKYLAKHATGEQAEIAEAGR